MCQNSPIVHLPYLCILLVHSKFHMLKTIIYLSLLLFFQLSVSSCHSSTSSKIESHDKPASNVNPGHDTIPANQSASDKNSQTIGDGAEMNVNHSILENLSKSKNYSVFISIIEKSGLYKTLSQKGAVTVFAPSNSAFDKMDSKTKERLMSEAGRADREKFLQYHIIGGIIRSTDLSNGESVSTIEGEPITVSVENGKIKLKGGNGNSADIVNKDILSSNGIIHMLDGVLMPKGMK